MRYERGAIVELYEERAGGLKQSFRFDALPSGAGDLVVRLGVETELAATQVGDDEVHFSAPESGGIRIAEVLGVDASGAQARGTMRWSEGVLELVLPEEFVQRAVLPLVLDPMISSAQVINSLVRNPQLGRAANIDVAWLPGANVYYAVWTHDFAEPAAFGQLLTSSGAAVGTSHRYTHGSIAGPGYSFSARVASVVGAQSFAVVMLGAVFCCSDIFMSSVDQNGVASHPPIRIVSFPGSPGGASSLDVAGDTSALHDDALMAWTGSALELAQVDLPTRTVVKRITLKSGTSNNEVALPTSGGAAGRYLVTWRGPSTFAGDVLGAVVDRDLNVLVPPFPIAESAPIEGHPAVDGDGTRWVVAFARGGEIVCRGVTYDPASATVELSAERVLESGPEATRDAAVAWMGDSYAVAYAEQFGGEDWDIYLRSIESFECLDCEGDLLVFKPSTTDEVPAIASRRSAGGTGAQALVAWITSELEPPNFKAATAQQRLFRADDGQFVDLGGACGASGTTLVTCAHSGVATPPVGFRIEGAAPLRPAALFLGVSRLDLPCDSCVLVPDPIDAVLAPTDADGNAQVRFQVPAALNLAGFEFLAQWAVAAPSPCSPSLSLGTAYEVTIE